MYLCPKKRILALTKLSFARLWPRSLDRFDPQLILVSAGFDAHWSDPLGQMHLSTAAFAKLNEIILKLAIRSAADGWLWYRKGDIITEAMAACTAPASINCWAMTRP